MTDRELLNYIKSGKGLPPILSKDNKDNWSNGFTNAIDRMLGIIDEVSDEWLEDNCEWDWHGEMKKRVLTLKEGA